MKKLILLFLVATLSACGASYNTDFPPPNPAATLDETFPAQLGQFTRTLNQINLPEAYRGFEAHYGQDDIVIKVIQTAGLADADAFFKDKIVPDFDTLPTHSRGQFNGKWVANGTDANGRPWYGWVNQNWIFVINASNQDNFNLVLGNFKFISK